jgi:hypothetical protein
MHRPMQQQLTMHRTASQRIQNLVPLIHNIKQFF